MAEIVDRNATDIHACLAWNAGNKQFFLTGKGVVETQRHWKLQRQRTRGKGQGKQHNP
jgi:hypothetical protein